MGDMKDFQLLQSQLQQKTQIEELNIFLISIPILVSLVIISGLAWIAFKRPLEHFYRKMTQ